MELSSPTKSERVNRALQAVGLALIAVYILGSFAFGSRFSELHIAFSFLNFPIFIGEILLFICLILSFIIWIRSGKEWNRWAYFWIVYSLFFLVKAFLGYHFEGALAFRNAALFYYALFSVAGYTFYRKDMFYSTPALIFVISAMVIFITTNPYQPYNMTITLLGIIYFILNRHNKWSWFLLAIFLLILPYDKYFQGSRTVLIANGLSIVFIVTGLSLTIKVKRLVRVMVLTVLIGVLCTGVFAMADRVSLKTLFMFKKIKEDVAFFDETIAQRTKHGYRFRDLTSNIYNPSYPLLASNESRIYEEIKSRVRENYKDVNGNSPLSEDEQLRLANEEFGKNKGKASNVKESVSDEDKKKRRTQLKIGNIVFRIFIWRDMIEETLQMRPVFGFSYGKPFRSNSIEVLGWASEEWLRDGWISMHNSFLHYIYRGGIIGVFWVVFIFAGLFKLSMQSIRQKSVIGIILAAILINWLAQSNFLPILELPHNAIGFWTLFGILAAYCRKNQLEDRIKTDDETR